MQNAQNNEIQQRVINLVELYRTKVGKESQIAKDAKEDYEYWEQMNMDMVIEAQLGGSLIGDIYGEGPHTELWIKHLMVNEQLLGHFYIEVAGQDAEQDVLDQLLPEVYDKTIFTEEEELFLKLHFKEMVNYIILTPCDDSLEWVNRHDNNDAYTIPSEVLDLIKSRVEVTAASRIYYPNTIFAQLANLFDGCSYYCDTMDNAWTRVALYANNIAVNALDKGSIPSSCDAIVCYLPKVSEDTECIMRIIKAYNNLQPGGKLILLCPPALLSGEDNISFREMLVEGKAINEIIQLPKVMSNNASFDTYCLLIAEKGYKEGKVTIVDARWCFQMIENSRHYLCSFDITKFNTIMNDGKDPNTGLRKVVRVSTEDLSHDLLVPEVYTIERPSEAEQPIPLSSLCSLESTLVRDVQFDLPEDTPWITMSDLTPLFTGNLNMSDIRNADCPNNPPFVEGSKDYAFGKDGKFVDSLWGQLNSKKGHHVLEYRQCTFLDGNTDAVLYERSVEYGVRVAVVRAIGKPCAVSKGILVFCPKKEFDVNSLAAILRLPIVYRQLAAYEKYGVGTHLDDVLAPTDKRIIGDELSRMKKEEFVTKELEKDFEAGQKKQITKLEDYQHVMRKHIREISSSVRRMERFINGMESSEVIKSFLHERLEVIKTHRLYLSEDIERLNEENTYGKAVPFDIDHCLKGFKDYFGSYSYPIVYFNKVAQEALKQYAESHRKELSDMNNADRSKIIDRIKEEKSFAYVDIAEYNFCKVVRNILENARIHGFSTDISRNDYKIEIILAWNSERNMYQIDFRNNGDPLPDGLSKESYGENRKYAGKTGGTGIGGYEVADTVKHYKGDYAISQDGGWVVVSVYLPKSKSYEEGV